MRRPISKPEPSTIKLTVTLDGNHPCPCCAATHTYTFEMMMYSPIFQGNVTVLLACPREAVTFQAELRITYDEGAGRCHAEVASIGPASLMNQAIYEVGKKVEVDSPATGRNFASFMITTSTGAIALYFVILKFFIGNKTPTNIVFALIFTAPALLFLSSLISFLLAFLSQMSKVSLDTPEELKRKMEEVILRREKRNIIGLTVFVLGIVSIFLPLGVAFIWPGTLK